MLRLRQQELADASNVSLMTIKRLEGMRGMVAAQLKTVLAVKGALERAGITFIDEATDSGAGVRLTRPSK